MKLFDKYMLGFKNQVKMMGQLGSIVMAAFFGGCSDSEKEINVGEQAPPPAIEKSPTADAVRKNLEKAGLREGFDAKKNTIIAIGSYVCPADDKISESTRQSCFQKAFDNALGEMALCLSCSVEKKSQTTSDGDVVEVSSSYHRFARSANRYNDLKEEGVRKGKEDTASSVTSSSCSQLAELPIVGVSIINVVEGTRKEGDIKKYEISVAIAFSAKLRDSWLCSLEEDATSVPDKPGKYSIEQWVDKQTVSMLLGSRTMVDSNGDRWLIGTITDDGNIESLVRSKLNEENKELHLGPFSNELGPWGQKLTDGQLEYIKKAYALWTAAKLVGVDVKIYRKIEMSREKKKVDEDLRVKTAGRILQENDRVVWFERKGENPFTQAEITVLIGAVRCKDVKAGEREWAKKFYEKKLKALKK